MANSNSKVVDVTEGPLLKPLAAFAVPMMFSNILQLLFNAADIIVVGQFAGENAVAAVGSTTLLISTIISLFTGISIGANVLLSSEIGAKSENFSACMQTTYTLGAVLGVVSAAISSVLARPILTLLQTPSDIINQSVLYLRIVAIGQIGSVLYTFSRAILSSLGDTKSPLKYLTVSGIVNVILNIVLVVPFHLDVAGVAIATSVSQFLSAILIIRRLSRFSSSVRLEPKKLEWNKRDIGRILKVGIPTGIQNSILSISGLFVQSGVNSLGTTVVAGHSAANSLAAFITQSLNAFSQGCVTFASQNYGAGKRHRVHFVLRDTVLYMLVLSVFFAAVIHLAGDKLLGIYLPDSPSAVSAGLINLKVGYTLGIIMGLFDCSANVLRAIGHPMFPTITAILGTCVFRIVWTSMIFFPLSATLETPDAYRLLILSYPVSWGFTALINLICYFVIMRKMEQENQS